MAKRVDALEDQRRSRLSPLRERRDNAEKTRMTMRQQRLEAEARSREAREIEQDARHQLASRQRAHREQQTLLMQDVFLQKRSDVACMKGSWSRTVDMYKKEKDLIAAENAQTVREAREAKLARRSTLSNRLQSLRQDIRQSKERDEDHYNRMVAVREQELAEAIHRNKAEEEARRMRCQQAKAATVINKRKSRDEVVSHLVNERAYQIHQLNAMLDRLRSREVNLGSQ
jgi:hypothetical protein